MGGIVKRVVAYDFRVPLDRAHSAWDEWTPHRRQVYLSAQDVVFPLSADDSVWPSALSESAWDAFYPDADSHALAWTSVQTLEAAVAADGEPDGWLIAMTEACDRQHLGQSNPADLGAGAVFVGYDVVDAGGLSVLMNHGRPDVSVDDGAGPSAAWAPLLNGFHLFDDVVDAKHFRRVSKEEELVLHEGGNGHGQFCVIGVWVLNGQKWANAP